MPDAFEFDGPLVARFADAGLAPLDSSFSPDEPSDSFPTILTQGSIGEVLYALGAFDSAAVLYYDRQQLERARVATVVLLDVLVHWSDFLWPLLISTRADTRTVQLGLANLFTEPPLDWGAILACSVLATLPVLAAFRFFQRYLVATDLRAGIR